MKTEIFERLKGEAFQSTDWESMDSDTLLERVVELAVKECIQVCADRGTHHDGLYSAWADDCSERIGKHFGVTE